MKLNTATCGHKIEEGISCSIDDGQMSWDGNRCVTFGTYCARCLYGYYTDGIIENEELKEFAQLLNSKNKLEKLQTENAKLRECVEFYADVDNHDLRETDFGKLARQVLKELEV